MPSDAGSSFLDGSSAYTCPAWATGGWDLAAPGDERAWWAQGCSKATCQDSSAASLLLPAEPSRGLTGLSPGLDSEMDFWESTVARSCNPDRSAGQRWSGPRPPQPCHHPTYLDPFRACMQGVGPAAPANSHTAQAATAVSTCQSMGTSASAGPV